MKKELIHLVFAAVLFASCTGEDAFAPHVPVQAADALSVSVSVGRFTNADNSSDSRASDSADGNTLSFEGGDRIGITVLDADGNLLYDNIPYTYSGSSWSFDSGNNEGKAACYHDSKAATYIAYFPYSKDADGILTVEGLKTQFPPKLDQRKPEDFRASDLLVWTSSGQSVQRSLTVEFTHAYSLLSFSPLVKFKSNLGETVLYIPDVYSSISFTLSAGTFIPYRVADGSFRMIVASENNADVRWVFENGGKPYGGTITGFTSAENTRYTFTSTKDIGDYKLENARIGDFYCKATKSDGSTTCYLIPGDAASIPNGRDCLGVVLKVGKDSSDDWKDEGEYTQKDGTTKMTDFHGYVLALYDANNGTYCKWGDGVDIIGIDQTQYTLFCGYANTQAIKKYITDYNNDNSHTDKKDLQHNFPATYYATEDYENKYPSPDDSSGWFFPSSGQGCYWYQNREILLSSVRKATGKADYNWMTAFYWSSSERSYGYAWYVYFYPLYLIVYNDFKGNTYRVRSCLAF
ncbi:MAG: hypothetical protein LUI85_01390 [Bacteroides sp.]|nr:hypothetical protein [Bacteroides sp.]